ncbi:hypothetical protein [Aureispira sp. CCB-E]|uniref:hypothetical protein n=1 Tax=Aureispira sp. CCB-E TaxID=3051121 RepID=UPI00286942BC|nr:hypothetical protein [Aureispira sp. CCB-E]WMX16876.1 hypothetical protein QP953_10885 [Aureispira sp. CCB-E]
MMIGLNKYCGIFFSILIMVIGGQVQAQKLRFNGHYPLATPKKGSESQAKAEYEKTVTAMLGGVRLMALNTTPTKREDPEAFTKDDYKAIVAEMGTYATELCEALKTDYANDLKKIEKSIKSNKFSSAISSLEKIGAQSTEDAETIFFIWKEYLEDKKKEAPWTNPDNIQITRVYRAMLTYVSKNYERPFGAQAEQGAIIADAAQALSNCMENPTELAWKGESKMNMKKEDELRRLASNVSYYNWRLHDPVSGKRSAHIDPEVVDHLQQALFDVVRTTIQEKDRWNNDPSHGANLLRLFEDTRRSGWTVNGDRAKKSK